MWYDCMVRDDDVTPVIPDVADVDVCECVARFKRVHNSHRDIYISVTIPKKTLNAKHTKFRQLTDQNKRSHWTDIIND